MADGIPVPKINIKGHTINLLTLKWQNTANSLFMQKGIFNGHMTDSMGLVHIKKERHEIRSQKTSNNHRKLFLVDTGQLP